ncbi:hypothetical protein ACGFW5_30425 [Streptomyces sp. NPDC048416]|uniref:hypothetical protein n=1 Tax=Streptomyces sp. NPDC048416 TaxID=3365546 RepID=UPI003716D586
MVSGLLLVTAHPLVAAADSTVPSDAATSKRAGPAQTRRQTQPRKATKELRFGRNPASVANADWFSGQIDDVWAYQGVLSSAGIAQLARGDELDSADGPAN